MAGLVVLAILGLFMVGVHRLQFDADVLNSLPRNDPVLADAHYIITHHPIYDRVVVDVSCAGGTTDALMEGARLVEARMRDSGLFREVGFQDMARLMPELMHYIADHLPILFSARDLEKVVLPLLASENIHRTLQEHLSSLQDLGGIGQTAFLTRDPLALRNQILSRFSSLAPAKGARIQNGQLVSADGKHALIIAEPATPGMDTRHARRIASLMGSIAEELDKKYGPAIGLTLTPVGAYRAALDNETSAKRSVKKAILFSSFFIALLLLASFPRPMIGLLSLLPAFAGTMMAFFVFSLFHRTISLMAVGFGGAIISFTVDYGIAYLLFLDRPHETRGLKTSKEVWSLGLLAMLTTAVSFAFLSFSGFPALAQIGQFAALGVVFTYIFVHAVFPLVFPVMPPAKRPPWLPLQRLVNRLCSAEGMWKVYAAIAFGAFMLLFAKPDFRIDLNAMNAVSAETLQADQRVRDVWGDIFTSVYLMVEGRDRHDFERKSDKLAAFLDDEADRGNISQFFVSSLIFPGEERAKSNGAAWRSFWKDERIAGLKGSMQEASGPLGFTPQAFEPFFRKIRDRAPIFRGENRGSVPNYQPLWALLGVKASPDGHFWRQVVAVTPGPAYAGEAFYQRISAAGLAKVFDPALFSQRLGALLLSSFLKMALIVGLITILTAFLYFLDWRLTVIAMAPTLFALVCTLGTLKLLGQPLGIPTIMVAVVVIGMGTDYALYLVRAHQRYLDEHHPSLGLIRLSIFLSFATTFTGLVVLTLSGNVLLQSAGLSLALGVGYSFLGAVMIAPPLLKRFFAFAPPREGIVLPGSRVHLRRTVARYRGLEAYPRLFARFKILFDPMFPRLADFVKDPKIILDIGAGFGVPAVWLLELFPQARAYGIEPDGRRVRVASYAIGTRGAMTVGAAPELPTIPEKADTVLMLDMIHMLTDEALLLTLRRLRENLRPDGMLVLRATEPSRKRFPWKRWIEVGRIKFRKGQSHFRAEAQIMAVLADAGFSVVLSEVSGRNHEERWFIAKARDEGTETAIPALEVR
ncbi:MAG: MMPL family transporter [Syntrophales bacterium]|nr:MMPL family transporter [Syntrophales bacterium]